MKQKKTKWAAYARPDGTFDFESLTPRQKEEFYREAERVDESTPSRPLNSKQKALHDRVRRRGRPRVGLGFLRWNVSLEKSFAGRIDAYAKRRGISRSRALAQGAELLLARGNATGKRRREP